MTEGRATTPAPADQTAVRRLNLARVLAEVRGDGAHSRAGIATRTGLTKATVSSLVSELIERRLVRETGLRQEGTVGRPSRLLELDGRAIAATGLELNANYLAVRATDLAGRVLAERRIGFDAARAGAARAVQRLAELARETLAELRAVGARMVGVGVAVPGLVDADAGTVRYAPNLLWHDVPIARWLRNELDLAEDVMVLVDNEANLSALAEFRRGQDTPPHSMVYLTGETGIGAGLVVDGRLMRGAGGFSGEVGHIPVDPNGPRCGCGRIGCLESRISLSVTASVLDDPPRDPEDQAEELRRQAEAGQPDVLSTLDESGRWLGTGLSILVNLLNPDSVVLGGYFATVAPYVVPAAMRELRERTIAGEAAICPITASTYGFRAAVRGGTSVIVEEVFQDPAGLAPVS